MDYQVLASTLLEKMQSLRNANHQKSIDEALHGEIFVLHLISLQDAAIQPSDISSVINVSSARVAQILNSIERKGWITREIDTHDRRKILVRLTSEGMAAAADHRKRLLDLAEKMLRMLGDPDAAEYVRITSKLADIISENDIESALCEPSDRL